MSWREIRSVKEFKIEREDLANLWRLTFTSAGQSFSSENEYFDGQIGASGYDSIKALVAIQVPYQIRFIREAPLPKTRATEEFYRCRERTTAALSVALKSGKFSYLERYYEHMMTRVELFSLEDLAAAQDFLGDYAEILSRTHRTEEAERVQWRIKGGRWR